MQFGRIFRAFIGGLMQLTCGSLLILSGFFNVVLFILLALALRSAMQCM